MVFLSSGVLVFSKTSPAEGSEERGNGVGEGYGGQGHKKHPGIEGVGN